MGKTLIADSLEDLGEPAVQRAEQADLIISTKNVGQHPDYTMRGATLGALLLIRREK